jgi:mono/diheme cytochrome c family protein
MVIAARAVAFAVIAVAACFAGSVRAQSADRFAGPRGDYLLNCAGCHGFHGVSNPRLVPNLENLVGFYLRAPEGRAYLSRVPNVAFSTLDDDKLAAVLNYVVFEIGGASAPPGAKPYSASEVRRWRKQPLTELPLSQYRQQLVERLIERDHVPAALRVYGNTY